MELRQTTSDKILAVVQELIEPRTERPYLQASVSLSKFLLEQTRGFAGASKPSTVPQISLGSGPLLSSELGLLL